MRSNPLHAFLALALTAYATTALAAPKDLTFTVDATTNLADANVGDESCATAGGQCTLRAAIQEIDAYTDGPATLHKIKFSVTNVQLDGSGLPSIDFPTVVDGGAGRVEVDGNDLGSCFKLTSPSGDASGSPFLPGLPNFNNSRLEHLVIHNCNSDGVELVGHGYVVSDSYVGLLPNGVTVGANDGSGISVTAPAGENSIPPALANFLAANLPADFADIPAIVTFLVAALPNIAPNAIVGNVVSGNDGDGIRLFGEFSTATIVFDNKIGTDATGLLPASNNDDGAGAGYGVFVTGAAYANFIGVDNLIAGNSETGSGGVFIDAGKVPFPNFVFGNQVGVNLAAPINATLGNAQAGIRIGDTKPTTDADVMANANTIKNPLGLSVIAGPGNVVGYNGDPLSVPTPNDANAAVGGIVVSNANAEGVRIIGNIVGISEPVLNFVDVGNFGDGINVVGTKHQIGGDSFLLGNVVGGNSRHGLVIRGGSAGYGHVVRGNRIGTLPDALEGTDVGNAGLGVWIRASNVELGGPDFGTQRNVVAFNDLHAVKIDGGASSIGNLVQQNAIFGVPAGQLGIDLDQASNAPDPTDNSVIADRTPTSTDNDANWGQNTVVLALAASGPPTWTLQSGVSSTYRIDFYSTPGDPRGGKIFLCQQNVTTDAAGNANGVACAGNIGEYMTATVTDTGLTTGFPAVPGDDPANDPVNNTSEFSNGVLIPQEIRFVSATYTVGEASGPAAITLERIGTGAASIELATIGGTATGSGTDYTFNSPLTVSWVDGDPAQKTVDVTIVNDTLDEADETVTFDLANPQGAIEGTPNQATLTITDDDAPPSISIGDVSLAEGTGGATTAFTFTASLSTASGQTVSVTAQSAVGVTNPATVGVDYTTLPATVLTFAAGATTATATVLVAQDATDELDETFFVNLTSPVNATIADAQALGTITNDDLAVPTFSIADASIAEGNLGSTNLTFDVTRAVNTVGTASVQVTTTDGSATVLDADYVALSNAIVNFADGQTTAQATVVLNGDAKFETDETFDLTLSNPSAGTFTDDTATGTIVNDDTLPTLSINDVSLAEGNASTTPFTFTVSLSAPSSQTVTVDVTTTGDTATLADNDFVSASTTLTFMPGATTQTFTVDVVGDTTDEPAPQDFFVDLTNASNANIADAQGIGTIQNDDVAGAASFAIDDVTLAEGDVGATNFTFTVARTGNTTGIASIDVTTSDGTATVGDADYASNTTTLSFGDGIATATFTVLVTTDLKFETDENFTVTLSNQSTGTIADATGTGTVTNDDAQPTVSVAAVTASEGNVGPSPLQFTLVLSNPSSLPITVAVATTDGSATLANNDYVAVAAQVVTFPAGSTQQTVTVNAVGDTDVETDETFALNLSNPVNATIAAGSASVVGTIQNDDAAAGVPAFTIADVTLAEGDVGTTAFAFTITRAGDLANPSSVQATTVGITADASDFVPLSQLVDFAAGVATQTISIDVTADLAVEPDETFAVNLSNATNGTVVDGQGLGTIVNDDSSGSGSVFTIADVTQVEGNGSNTIVISITRSPSTDPASVTISISGGSATAGSDYVAIAPIVLNFAAGQATATVSITVNGDISIEDNETITLTLSNPVGGTIGDAQGIVTLTNDDAAIAAGPVAVPTLSRASLLAAIGMLFLVGLSASRRSRRA